MRAFASFTFEYLLAFAVFVIHPNLRALQYLTMAAVAGVLLAVTEASAVTLNFLPVGDAGNQSDTRPNRNFGAVPYTFYLDKYDVTNAQYVEFLNAKSGISDPYSLFDLRMSSTVYGGITRSETAPFTYAAKPGMANKPVVYVTWYDALRFTNWLTNGQGNGDTETGSYLIDSTAGVVT